jgi:glycerol-3-phosphate O-acyltransferase
VTADRIRQAALARADLRRFIDGEEAVADPTARTRIDGYLDELRTTQRHSFYRALKHPLYPILRKIDRIAEGLPGLTRALDAGRVVYVSNHKSHLDYLIEPLILEDHNLRPPIIAAGINLFGGALGLLHKHVTGAIPIRRTARDPAYLVTLKAYVAELLRFHDLFFYLEGGRSYSGELKGAKTGLFHAVLMADVPLVVVPVAVAYDLVLEDSILARQGTKGRQRPFTRELAEMVGTAVGYRSRAFVTFGEPLSVERRDLRARRDAVELAQTTRHRIGRLHKVLPTALVASVLRPSMPIAELTDRVRTLIDTLSAEGANLDTTDAAAAVDSALDLLTERDVVAVAGRVVRVRQRFVLRYYGRQISHLLSAPPA